jgi:hypothetical protein
MAPSAVTSEPRLVETSTKYSPAPPVGAVQIWVVVDPGASGTTVTLPALLTSETEVK